MTSMTMDTLDEAKLDEFLGRFVGDLGAALSAALVVIGDKLGLYRAMGDGQPMTPEQLAERTRTDPRYVLNGSPIRRPGGTSATPTGRSG